MRHEIEFIAQATQARKIGSGEFTSVATFSTDSRKNLKDTLFVALKGELHDAHDFVLQSYQNGARAFMVHRFNPDWEALKSDCLFLQVSDTLLGFQQWAQEHRRVNLKKVVGITGSNGKTTTKEFLATMCSPFLKTHFNVGSFNNHWGVPMTLLQAGPEHDLVIAEMGMNHKDEITRLVEIGSPDVVVCTMVGRAHIENFGSIEGIASAKEEIYSTPQKSMTRVFNLDNPWTALMYKKFQSTQSQKITFSSLDKTADVYLKIDAIESDALLVSGHVMGQSIKTRLPVFGEHNLTNVLSALALGLGCGVSSEKLISQLGSLGGAWGRNQWIKSQLNTRILFDGYNANPDSMKALLTQVPILSCSGVKVGVFAEMKELGEAAQEAHFELGKLAGSLDFAALFFYGPSMSHFEAGVKSANFKNTLVVSDSYKEELALKVQNMLRLQSSGENIVFLKGSRSMKLERVVEQLLPVDFESKK